MALSATCMWGRGVNYSSPLPGILEMRLPQEGQQRLGAFPYVHHTMYPPNNENNFPLRASCLIPLSLAPASRSRAWWSLHVRMKGKPGLHRSLWSHAVCIVLATDTIRSMGDSSQLCWKRCHGPIALPWPHMCAQG